nr:hypothetical protein [uncultured Draconibacterium sp.]
MMTLLEPVEDFTASLSAITGGLVAINDTLLPLPIMMRLRFRLPMSPLTRMPVIGQYIYLRLITRHWRVVTRLTLQVN